jgi:hypothetical protein
MFYKHLIIGAIYICGLLGAEVAVHSGVAAAQSTSSAVSIADQDKDGTLDLAEVKTAASAKFDKMSKEADVDHDGTLPCRS